MATFNDLIFIKHPVTKGWAGKYDFKNGYKISVTCGETMYCTPKSNLPNPADYDSFEVAILDNKNEWATKNIIQSEDDVVGWISREEISELMARVETFENS